MEPLWQIYWVSRGYGDESSFANVCRMASIIRSPIEQFDDILCEEGSAFDYKGILVPFLDLQSTNLAV